jgi:DNA-binding NarL/FixJ family response regulator
VPKSIRVALVNDYEIELRWPGREARLTERETELLALLPTGMTTRELAAHLHLTESTIKSQLRSLFSKLKVRNRVQAASVARAGALGEHHSRNFITDAN